MKRLRPFFPYYGSKWRLAPKYPAPLYDTIIEPFAGSAQYATLYPDRKVVLCDLSEYVCGVWEYLIKATEADILRLPSVAYCIDDFPQLCQEEKWLIGFWFNQMSTTPKRNMVKHARISLETNDRKYLGNNYWCERNKIMLAYQSQFIKHWQIYNCSFERLSNPYATWFIDPPYLNIRQSKEYRNACVEHLQLHGWALSRMGETIICESVGAWWLPFRPLTDKEVFYHAHH